MRRKTNARLEEKSVRLIVTGGAGFIGSTVARRALDEGATVVVVDALTYAGDPANLEEVKDRSGFAFVHADIRDADAMAATFRDHDPDAVLHLAAESHVDRSIDGPLNFVRTNVEGTAVLLEAARRHWRALPSARRDAFRFHHVSTDEVFGALGPEGAFDEATPYAPNSPYAASKAGSDHLVRAWGATYGLPVIVTNCSNNYGPRQHPEKLIPTLVETLAAGLPAPIYGDGRNVRDWLFVEDHAEALLLALRRGAPGETYAIGGGAELANIDLARRVATILDALSPRAGGPHADLITLVADRPGHDFRYAIDGGKIARALGWRPATSLDAGLETTVRWYLDNAGWRAALRAGGASGARLGLTT